MKLEDFKLVIVEDGGTYGAYFDNDLLSGMIVQVDNINDIPEKLGLSFQAIISKVIKDKKYQYRTITPDK